MSVDQDVERSMLERKDRADLVTMATALGEKPPARAKKADIVDLILRVTNVGPAPAASEASPPGTAVDQPATSVADSDEAAELIDVAVSDIAAADVAAGAGPARTGAEADPRPADNGRSRSGGGEPVARAAEDHLLDSGAAASVSPDEIGRPEGPADASPRRDGQGPQAGTRHRPTGVNAAEDGRGGQAPRRAIPQGEGDHQDQQDQQDQQGDGGQRPRGNQQDQQGQGYQQGQRPDDFEPGNRRRRRRGRDRGPSPEVEESLLGEPVDVVGLLDLRDEGYGFLRLKGFLPSKDDVYVSVKQVRQFGLRKGDKLNGKSRPASRNEKNPALLQIDQVNGSNPDSGRERPRFEDLTPLFPEEKLRLERSDDSANMTARIVDLIAPIGKGQRGLIVSPPKAGKTTVMKQIARSVEVNNPEVELIVLLVDERPEEVTDMRRWLLRGEVAASTFDRPSEEHTTLAELVIERAKRLVEEGKDVVIILDGITRLARAYNLAAPASGRIMSGGIDAAALYPPKRFFGAARNVEEGGSLTILATALVETNSRMDDHIFEEFKGTGNMELKLDRKLADRRIYPAIDVDASSTRHEELLFERRQLQQVWRLRRVLSGLSGEGASGAAGLELLIDRMKTFKSNDEFLAEVAKAPSV